MTVKKKWRKQEEEMQCKINYADRQRERYCALKRSRGDSRWWGLLWTKILWDLQREGHRHKPLQTPSARNRPKRAVDLPLP